MTFFILIRQLDHILFEHIKHLNQIVRIKHIYNTKLTVLDTWGSNVFDVTIWQKTKRHHPKNKRKNILIIFPPLSIHPSTPDWPFPFYYESMEDWCNVIFKIIFSTCIIIVLLFVAKKIQETKSNNTEKINKFRRIFSSKIQSYFLNNFSCSIKFSWGNSNPWEWFYNS